MSDIFISYSSSDKKWADWIGLELEKLGHVAHIHEWEIDAGGDIPAWMEDRIQKADRVLCVVSSVYLTKPYSSWERRAAQWAAASNRPNFVVPIFVEDCEAPITVAHLKRCDLYGLTEVDARNRLESYLKSAARPLESIFPGQVDSVAPMSEPKDAMPFPGKNVALSNIPIRVPRHFLGRDDALEAIDVALKRDDGRVAITALHGLRGVGKSMLAAAYAERHRLEYRATWWIRAQTESTMRADLVALGVRLGWVAPNEKEEPALAALRERLRHQGEGLLLIYDNAIDAARLRPFLPPGGATRVLVTSNAPDWRGIGTPIEIEVWPKEVGADYLVARTGRDKTRADAQALSEALGGLPLAHEQAGAYCARLGISLADYRKRYDAEPVRLLDTDKDAPAEFHDRLTVAKAFAIAIDEAAKLHPAAESLIVHAAMLASEPIPLFLFSEGREKFGEPLASQLAGDGLDEAVWALRVFALVDRESIPDERDPSIVTDAIRLHRLVRTVAAGRLQGDALEDARRVLIDVLAEVFPGNVFNEPSVWPRARRLEALALHLVGRAGAPPDGAERSASYLLDRLGSYSQAALATYSAARTLYERALAIREKALGLNHRSTAASLNNLGRLLHDQGDLPGARVLYERALEIDEKIYGRDSPNIVIELDNLALLLQAQGDVASAQPLLERVLTIREKALGVTHRDTAMSLNNVARLLQAHGDLAGARPLFERALEILKFALGADHPSSAKILRNHAMLLLAQGDLVGARSQSELALAISEKAFGSEHPDTATSLGDLARVLVAEGDAPRARSLFDRALTIFEKAIASIIPRPQVS
jgi:tetratricopeptide (TPR) repeat protein